VILASNVANSVILFGEVRNPGRVPLSVGTDHLLDVIALSGGPTRPAADTELSVIRGGKTVITPMSAVLTNPEENIRLAPHDQIRLLYKPRKFTTFGALGRTSQAPIEDDTLTLAAALSRSGGLDNNSANASALLLFRFERPEVARALGISSREAPGGGIPVVYRLDLHDPSGYFIASKFEMQADDLIFAPRSDTAELGKFFTLISTITQVAYNLRVAVVLP
jgi:polysaccharide export outer membrane protein